MSTQFTNRQWRLPNNENKDKQSNYSIDFDGTQSVDVGTVTINNSGSFSIWFKISNIAFYQNILGSSNASGMFKYITLRNGTLYQYVLGTGWIVLYSTSLNDNEWHNLIFTYDSTTSGGPARGTFKSYVDGVLTKTYDMINDISEDWSSSTLTSIAYFGTTQPLGPRYFDGKIDGVSIFDYALSSSQVTTLYGSSSTGIGNPMSLSPKPVAYYPLGDQDAFNGADYLVPNSSLKDYVFDFDGNDYVTLNSSINLTGNKTVSYWVNPDSLSGNVYIGGVSPNYYTYMTSTFLYIKDSTGFSTFSINISTGNWYHICITGDGTNATLYINKNPISTTNDRNPTIDTIGAYNGGGGAINAKMSNVQIFNTALPATGSNSVETLYNNGSPLTSMSGFTSLQGWWKLDASATYDSSTNTWTIPDDSTNSNTGTSSGMTQANLVQSDLSFTSGYSPYALDFDRASIDSITINADLSSYSSITVSTWAKFVSSTGFQYVFDAGTYNASGPAGIKLGISKIQTTNEIATYDGLTSHSTGVNVALNTWYHITVTHAGTTRKVYLNGSLIGTFVSGNLNLNAINYIGRFSLNTNFMDGSISNVSIWDTDLTSAQVTEIYNEGLPSNLNNHSAYSNLVSWWQLGSNSSFNTNWTVLDEVTASGNNGTSVNMGEDAIVDGVGSYANGLSSGMGGDEVIGDAPYSSSNALSVNMDVEDRVTDVPS
jgi:hypothetical protein